ncbi:MAG TPA: carboxypeptidase regulatory-like domain-containing protein [Acidobacteriaceae bacterium]|nr:carboxypeptidase regulatory-like domain-containing protein [Acidobacteriaceae bacterium]
MAVLALLAQAGAFAQVSNASLTGVVRDPQSAVVPSATISLINLDTSVNRTTVSNSAGTYAIQSIVPGHYALHVTAAGFGQTVVPAFTLTVGQAATVDVQLAVASQKSVVKVEANAAQLEVSSANLGTVITTKQVQDLPLNGRNFTQLLELTPGVAPVSTGQNSMNGFAGGFAAPVAIGSSFSFPAINGQSNRSNFFLADGLNDYGSFVSTYAVPPIIDAIQEFKVVSHTDSAEYGAVLGGVINVVTKSGTNELHGSGWEFARNAIFDARTYFLPPSAKKAEYNQNQFGGSVGGPVLLPRLYNGRNRTFFFGAYQGFHYTQTSNISLRVPTDAQLAGDESDWPTQIYNPNSTRPDPNHPGQYIRDPFPGNQIPSGMIDQRMVDFAKFTYPAAGPVFDSNGDNAIDTTPTTQTQNEFNIRIDERVGSNDSAFFRYSFINSSVTTSGGVPGLPSITAIPARDFGGSYVHVFGPTMTGEIHYAHVTVQDNNTVRYTKPTTSVFNDVGFASGFAGGFSAVGGINLVPYLSITDFASGGESIYLTPKATDSSEYSANITKLIGTNELHSGVSFTTNVFASPIAGPTIGFAAPETGDTNPMDTVNTGDPIASFVLNVPDNASRRNVNEETRPGGVFSAYVQDSWRATSTLTLNAGLRYDLTLIPRYGTAATVGQEGGPETGDVDFTNGTYVLQDVPPTCAARGHAPCIPGSGTLPDHVVVDPRGTIAYNTYDNIGPRVGVADRITKDLVLHGAFGIVYDNWAAVNQTAQAIEGAWPDIGQEIANNLNYPSSTSPTPTVTAQDPFGAGNASLFPAATPFNQVDYFYDPHRKNPMSYQWNVGVETMLGPTTTATLNYVGSASKRLDVGGYYNTALTPGPGDPQARAKYPYMAATYWDHSVGSSSYNAMQASVDRRFHDGWSYAVAYTWSKSINVGTDGWYGEGGVPQDPYHPGSYGSRSVAGTDLRNVLSVNTLYHVPLGRGYRFSTGSPLADYILGNWQINNIFFARSGLPFTPYISSDIANTGNTGGYETADVIGNPNLSKRSAAEWFNTAAYTVPAGYTFGTAGRDSLRTNGDWNLDLSLFRLFPIENGRQVEFRAEAFNLFNNVVLGYPIADLNSGSSFGTVNSTANTSRELQLGLKFEF